LPIGQMQGFQGLYNAGKVRSLPIAISSTEKQNNSKKRLILSKHTIQPELLGLRLRLFHRQVQLNSGVREDEHVLVDAREASCKNTSRCFHCPSFCSQVSFCCWQLKPKSTPKFARGAPSHIRSRKNFPSGNSGRVLA
jgi:hypothetical protein